MKDFDTVKKLMGESVTENDIADFDYYVRPQLGVFIPVAQNEVQRRITCPSYTIKLNV